MMNCKPSKRPRHVSTDVDETRCIICQNVIKDPTTSSERGRMAIQEAAEIRKDIVYDRLLRLDSNNFVYHVTNYCYKAYTHKRPLLNITNEKQSTAVDENNNDSSTRLTRSEVKPRNKLLLEESHNKTTCIVCCQIQNKGRHEKSRISESTMARKFLSATVSLQDDVFLRTCDLQDECSVFGANLYYHKHCMLNYFRRYDSKKISTTMESSDSPTLVRQRLFNTCVSEFHEKLQTDNIVPISELRDHLNSLLPAGHIQFNNRQLRMLIYDHFGEDIYFNRGQRINKSSTAILTTGNAVTQDDSSIIKQCAKVLRDEILTTDFDLSDKFCDSNELKDSWVNTQIPTNWQLFFSILFKIEKKTKRKREATRSDNFGNDDDDDDDDVDSIYGSIDDYTSDESDDDDKDEAVDENDDDDEDYNGDTSDASVDQVTAAADGMKERCSTENDDVDRKATRMKALFQVIFFNIYNGRKRTPLHIMNAQSIHDKCKSRELITCLNHYGLGISYNELQKYHNDMASLIVKSSSEMVPLPSQFNKGMFTTAAFDNFDHEEATLSGINGSHDTVSVLFQEKTTALNRKPLISEMGITHGSKPFQEQLKCQCLQPYTKPSRKPRLHPNFKVCSDPIVEDKKKQEEVCRKDTAWTLSRMNLTQNDNNILHMKKPVQLVPSWSAFNSLVSQADVNEMIVGFLPVIPYPVTDYQTVNTALKNFQEILTQLDQKNLPVACDEGVYHIAREIIMTNPLDFSNLVLILGSFHMTKVFLGCIGRYLRSSGAEHIWIENSVFGPNVVQSVLGGSHYARSFKGMLLLGEAMERLQWKVFFEECGMLEYQNEFDILADLQLAVAAKDVQSSTQLLEQFEHSSEKMSQAFASFREERSSKSETFLYWDHFIELVRLLRNLVRADREGDWHLHLYTVQSILPYFAVFDCTNYLRWCSLYLEDMRRLQETAPDVYSNFMKGMFVVKRTPGKFRAVAADQSLEQTINKSQKSSGGIIGSSRKKDFVSEWEIIYHEMLEVSNLHRELGRTRPFLHELTVHHEFSKSDTNAREKNVTDMMGYVEIYENPFIVTCKTEPMLHNIVTQEVMTSQIRENMTHIKEKGTELYENFRQDRLVLKEKALSDTIHRNNIKTFNSISVQSPSEVSSKKQKNKDIASGHRYIEICQARGNSTKKLFKYDLVQSNAVFDAEGLIKKTQKSGLIHELEKYIDDTDNASHSVWQKLPTVFLVDVMANIRKVSIRNIRTFGDFCEAFIKMTLSICSKADRIDFVFDSYIEMSIKDSERTRRSLAKPIEISIVKEDTPLPVHMDTFWASGKNKTRLQDLLRKSILSHQWQQSLHIVLSGIHHTELETPCVSVINKTVTSNPELDLSVEEADVRMIPHAVHATTAGSKRCVIISGDTDVVVLALHFFRILQSRGLIELWIRAGIGNSTRYIPLHKIAEKKSELCKVLIAAHILTGCDVTSKVGSKLSALKVSPELYLGDFGKSLDKHGQDIVVSMAENYLVKVTKNGTTCTTMDELRYELYHQSKVMDLSELPPTSAAIRLHILRSLYVCYMQMNCLIEVTAKPTDFGFEEKDGLLLPSNPKEFVPNNLVLVCSCIKCSTKRCVCRKAGVPCCIYCKCKSGKSDTCCKNPHVLLSVPVLL